MTVGPVACKPLGRLSTERKKEKRQTQTRDGGGGQGPNLHEQDFATRQKLRKPPAKILLARGSCSQPHKQEMSVTGAQIEAPSSAETHRTHDAEVVVDDDDDDDPSAGAAGPVSFWPHRFSWRKLWRFTGPGWLMSLAYLDPGNLESDLQQGGYTGYQLLWVLWWATVMGFLLQEMVARLGIVAGRDLAQTVRSEYPRWLCYVVYVMMECAVIGADIQEVVGSAIALNLLTGGFVPVVVGCAITALDTFTFLAVEYLAREDGARWSRHLSPPHTPPATPRRACATSRRSSASSSAPCPSASSSTGGIATPTRAPCSPAGSCPLCRRTRSPSASAPSAP